MDEQSELEKLKSELRSASLDDLNYILGRYCGPYNKLLREKKYGHLMAKKLHKLVDEELFYRSLDNMLLKDE